MTDYETMYKELFRTATQVIEALKKAQQTTEEIYMRSSDAEEEE